MRLAGSDSPLVDLSLLFSCYLSCLTPLSFLLFSVLWRLLKNNSSYTQLGSGTVSGR